MIIIEYSPAAVRVSQEENYIRMENGDYVKMQGHLCKIMDINNTPPVILDCHDQQNKTKELIGCNITINDNLLCGCCGFCKIGKYCIAYLRNGNSHFLIAYDRTDLTGLCYIVNFRGMELIRSDSRIIVLSVLQDFVRENTNCELNINESRLITHLRK